jgi:hypothetical protein
MTTRRSARVVTLCALLLTGARHASADGERSPFFGLAVVGAETARTPDHAEDLAGVGLDLAWWHGRFGLAAEGTALWSIDPDGARALVLGGSARLRVLERMVPSLIDPRDVELGLELQAIVERAWWNVAVSEDPTAYGVGIALRARGGGDPDGSLLVAESRFFLRVMSAKWSAIDAVARTMTTPASSDRALTVMFGIGASFGAASPAYMDRFRMHPFEKSLLW